MSELRDDRRRLQTRVAQLESELAESQARVTSLERGWEQWLRLISHDFRGPLTLMLGYSQSLLQHLPDEPSRDRERSDLRSAIMAAQRLDKMIGEIVDGARLEAHLLTIVPGEVDLAPIVYDQVKKARRRYSGREIRTYVRRDLPSITTDPRRVGEIIAALLSNAILFSSDASTVLLATRQDGDQIVVSVRDWGVGIAGEEHARLFERFYRPDRLRAVRREGLGLSLMIADQLATRLNGRLWAKSNGPDRGSTFFFSVPCQGPACAL